MAVMDDVRTLGDVLYQAFVTFPYHAYTTPRSGSNLTSRTQDPTTHQPQDAMHTTAENPEGDPKALLGGGTLAESGTAAKAPETRQQQQQQQPRASAIPPPLQSETFSNDVFVMCTSIESVSSVLASEPSLEPKEAWQRLYGRKSSGRQPPMCKEEDGEAARSGSIPDDFLDKAARCGRWGAQKPSELFLKMFHDALVSIDGHPDRAMVSPCLMGSSGVLPLTVISTIPDIVRHMANLIVRAEHDVILATNFWQNSVASKFLTDALKELSRRVGARGTGQKVVVKVMYDRGSIRQLVEPHALVPEKDYAGSAVGLPAAPEIPNLDMQVMNYHNPILGTFHCKYMVVDRRIAVLQSNNIQDNDNLEMMVHLEGPIVDSIYDVALLSWSKELTPPLPTHDSPASRNGIACFRDAAEAPETGDPSVVPPESAAQTSAPAQTPAKDATTSQVYEDSIASEARRVQASLSFSQAESFEGAATHMGAVTRHLNHTTNRDFKPAPEQAAPEPESDQDWMRPYLAHGHHEPFPMALVNRAPHGPPNNSSVSNPQNAAWLAALKYATKSVFIQSPTLNAEPLLPAIIDACERGIDVTCFICLGYNDIGELLPKQGGHNEMIAHRLHKALSPAGLQRLHYHWYVGKDCTVPLVQSKRQRSCHIKLLVADERVAVVGNGNQDTQSWMHSQETNVMLDLPPGVALDWVDGLRRNQNTHLYGALDRKDGVWRDKEGNEAHEAIGVDPGRFSWSKGIIGALKRVQGTGGF